jgi:hypothetical protein
VLPRGLDERSSQMKGSIDRVMECTTGQFDGAIAVIQPKESWVVSLSPRVLDLLTVAGRPNSSG